MTVEIISKGALPEEKKYKGTCNNCRTTFTFQGKDAKLISDQRDGNFWNITCPLPGCGTLCYVSFNSYYINPVDPY